MDKVCDIALCYSRHWPPQLTMRLYYIIHKTLHIRQTMFHIKLHFALEISIIKHASNRWSHLNVSFTFTPSPFLKCVQVFWKALNKYLIIYFCSLFRLPSTRKTHTLNAVKTNSKSIFLQRLAHKKWDTKQYWK